MSSKNSKFGFENKNEIEGEFKAAKFAVNQKKEQVCYVFKILPQWYICTEVL